MGCSGPPGPNPIVETPDPGPSQTSIETTPAATTPPPTQTTPPTSTAVPVRLTPSPTLPPLHLDVKAPADESGVEVGFVRVIGSTSGTSATVNGLASDLDSQGDFHRDLTLREGVNLIDVVAADDLGQTASQQIVVFFVVPTAGLPFTLLYPPDGAELSEPIIEVVGVTRPDTIVGVNDQPVEVDGSGIFSATITLGEGPNLLEVVAADIEGNVRFQTSVVFYLP